MNWDWEKLQEKRQRQSNWNANGRGKNDQREDEDPSGEQLRQEKPSAPDPNQKTNRRPPGMGGNDPLQAMRQMRLPGLKWIVLGLVALWLLSGIYIVEPNQAGVVLRFGQYVYTTDAGPHYHWPYPIEQVYKPVVTQVRQAEVGFRSTTNKSGDFQQGRLLAVAEESSMLTGDENIIDIQFSIQYRIKPGGAVDYLFNVTNPDAVVKNAAEAAMREVIGNNGIDAALTDGKIKIQNDVSDLLQFILDRYRVGVEVVGVQMQDVQPPKEVSESFKDVASAREDKERIINEAQAYSNEILPEARGMAAQVLNQAEAYKQTRIMASQGESQRFLSVLAEYEKAQDVTKKRLTYETLEDILSQPGLEKLVLPDSISSQILPLLPLNSGALVPGISAQQGNRIPAPEATFSNLPPTTNGSDSTGMSSGGGNAAAPSSSAIGRSSTASTQTPAGNIFPLTGRPVRGLP